MEAEDDDRGRRCAQEDPRRVALSEQKSRTFWLKEEGFRKRFPSLNGWDSAHSPLSNLNELSELVQSVPISLADEI